MTDYWSACLLGLLGSLHCAGMCGPLVLAVSGAPGHTPSLLVGRFAYNAGRLLTYALLGVLFGAFGKTLVMAGLQRWLSVGLGIVVLLGLAAWKQPRLRQFLPSACWGLLRVGWLKSALASLLRRRSPASLGLLGLLNGLLPCGLVYVAGAGAAATAGIGSGAEYMLIFGAGTVPMLLALSLAGQWLPSSFRLKLAPAIPIAIFLLAALLILRGLSLGIPYLSPHLGFHPSSHWCCPHPNP